MITLTQKAVEQVKHLQKENEAQGQPLRLGIEKGGCSGFEYAMGFDQKQEGDVAFDQDGVELVIDPASYEHLKGIEIDFDDGLHGKGFEIRNPNAENTCGCGRSFN